jgi:hypothetical protein
MYVVKYHKYKMKYLNLLSKIENKDLFNKLQILNEKIQNTIKIIHLEKVGGSSFSKELELAELNSLATLDEDEKNRKLIESIERESILSEQKRQEKIAHENDIPFKVLQESILSERKRQEQKDQEDDILKQTLATTMKEFEEKTKEIQQLKSNPPSEQSYNTILNYIISIGTIIFFFLQSINKSMSPLPHKKVLNESPSKPNLQFNTPPKIQPTLNKMSDIISKAAQSPSQLSSDDFTKLKDTLQEILNVSDPNLQRVLIQSLPRPSRSFVKYNIVSTLTDGDCFYSTYYRLSKLHKSNNLTIFNECKNIENEKEWIRCFRNELAHRIVTDNDRILSKIINDYYTTFAVDFHGQLNELQIDGVSYGEDDRELLDTVKSIPYGNYDQLNNFKQALAKKIIKPLSYATQFEFDVIKSYINQLAKTNISIKKIADAVISPTSPENIIDQYRDQLIFYRPSIHFEGLIPK